MNSNGQLVLFFSQDHISFLTNKVDTDFHQHHYIQITIDLDESFTIHTKNETYNTRGVVIDSNVLHKLHGNQQWQLYLLINPESMFGEMVKKRFLNNNNIYLFQDSEIGEGFIKIINALKTMDNSEAYTLFLKSLKTQLKTNQNINVQLDGRVKEILAIIEENPLDQLSIPYLSEKIYLSESRLSHLFKEEMGISISSYILHEKLKKAFQSILKGKKMTDAAIEAGFSSSSHFTKTAREKLGMTPRVILKNSRYLQV